MQCRACQHENRSEAQFCEECGSRLPGTSGSTSDGERRQLTVVFTDLVGSTELSRRLDAEDLRALLREYRTTCRQVIEGSGGYVGQYLGDGVLAYFGYPHAHEYDVERAVRAGLAIVAAVREMNPRLERELGARLAIRVGMHTGPVVAGQVTGEGPGVFGDTPNLAERLQALADPDSVVVSGATLRLVQGLFLTRDLGLHAIEGIERPVAVYQVLRASGVRSRLDVAGAAGLTPFVGREGEVELLGSRWEAAQEHGGQAVMVSGEAGIGKSRLVQAFRVRLAETSHTWLECRCTPYGQGSAFQPVIEMQSSGIGFTADDGPEQKLAKLEAALGRAGFSLPDVVPLLARLHSIPLPARYPAANLTPEALRRRTMEALRDWLIRMSRQQAVVLFVEDLHWVDPSTLELLGAILARLPTTRALMLLTHRPELTPPWPPAAHIASIGLGRLDRPTAHRFVTKAAGERPLRAEWIAEIVSKADGVPLFLEEIVKAIANDENAVLRLDVPATLKDLLMQRLDQLDQAKEVAQLAAILGREFSYPLLQAVWPGEEHALVEGLGHLLDAELVFRRAGEPHAAYVFKHALIQETAYESLLKTSRQHHHERIGTVLEERFPELADLQPELLAHHFTEAHRPEKAIPYWERAGQRGLERSTNIEAIRHMTRGLECVRSLPPSVQRSGQELALQTLLSVNLIANRGYAAEEVLANFARARELCDEIGETPQIFPVLFGLWLFHMVRADRRVTYDLAEQLLRLAEAIGDTGFMVQAHVANTLTEFWHGNFEKARRHAAEILARYSREAHRAHVFIYGDDPGVYAYIYDALSLWFLGYPDQASERMEAARSLADEVNHPFTRTGAQAFSTQLCQFRRETDRVYDAAEATIDQSQEQAFPLFFAVGVIHRGWSLVRRGEHETGRAQILQGLGMFRGTGARLNAPYFLSELAEACLAAGDRAQGLAALDEALALADTQLDRYYEPELHRLRGELLLLAPADAAGAGDAFRRALELARAGRARSLELRAATSMSRLLRERGSPRDARDLLAGISAWFTEGADTEGLVEARALLASLSV